MRKNSTQRKPRPVAPVSMPPLVAVLAAYAEGDWSVNEGFARAWGQMPAMVAQAANGGRDSIEGVTRWKVIESGADAAFARWAKNGYGVSRLKQIKHMREDDPDMWTDLMMSIGDSAFVAGMALALYLVTNGAPVAVNAGK